MRIPFTQVDAFADRPFGGNPAAVMPLEAWLDDATRAHARAYGADKELSVTSVTPVTHSPVPMLEDGGLLPASSRSTSAPRPAGRSAAMTA